jgi:hypothetical protein
MCVSLLVPIVLSSDLAIHNMRNKTQLNYHGVANDHSIPNCQLLTTGIEVVGKVVFPGKPTRVSGKQENAGEVLDNGGPGRANQPELGLEVFEV